MRLCTLCVGLALMLFVLPGLQSGQQPIDGANAVLADPLLSQQGLAEVLHMHPSALVAIIDELEQRGLVKRRDNLDDRRTYELHLTDKGQVALRDIGRVGQEHNESLCAALSPREREQLTEFLQRIADEQGLTPGIHPGFSRLGSGQKRPR